MYVCLAVLTQSDMSEHSRVALVTEKCARNITSSRYSVLKTALTVSTLRSQYQTIQTH